MKSFAFKTFAFLVLAQSMAPGMDLCCELQKLPSLFLHYEEHKAFDGDSFLQFLTEDYISNQGEEQGHHGQSDHDNLPFHGNHQCGHAPIFCTSEQQLALTFSNFSIQGRFGQFTPSFSSEYPESPFQPPKA